MWNRHFLFFSVFIIQVASVLLALRVQSSFIRVLELDNVNSFQSISELGFQVIRLRVVRVIVYLQDFIFRWSIIKRSFIEGLAIIVTLGKHQFRRILQTLGFRDVMIILFQSVLDSLLLHFKHLPEI